MKLLSKKGKWLMVLACTLYAAESVLIAVQVYLQAEILECAGTGNMTAVWWAVFYAVLVAVLLYLLVAAATYARLAFISNGEITVKSGIMKNILRRPIKSFRGENDAFYLNLYTADMDIYRNDFLNVMPYLFSTVAAIVSSAALLFSMNIWLLVGALVVSGLPALAVKPFTNIEQKNKLAYSKAAEGHTQVLKENIEGYETIRMSNREADFEKRYGQAAEERQKKWIKYNFVSTMNYETLLSVGSVSSIVCLGVGGWLVVRGSMSVAMLFAAKNYFTSLSNELSNITEYVVTVRSTKKTIEKLKSQEEIPYPADSGLLTEKAPDITYENVSFAFEEHELYRDFTHHFAAGGCYAIVGESGSGKSTLMKLLLKYFDEYGGKICLEGQDIRQLSESEIYERVGVVNQSPYLFNVSLYENITMFNGEPGENSEEYAKLLQDVNLTALAKRVEDKPLGDFGDNISGGERQRINLARAMCKHPSILIFDEPTTGLDPENVALIDEFIFSHKGVTRIVISHNWAKEYLDRFDHVVQIKDGKITEG